MHPRKLVRDSLGVALSSYLARLALLVRGVVAAAVLGPRGYGGWNALNLILDYGSYATCGALQGPPWSRAGRARRRGACSRARGAP